MALLLGLSPNAVAALAYQAREGLRQAYLQEHLANGGPREHTATLNRLGAWVRGGSGGMPPGISLPGHAQVHPDELVV